MARALPRGANFRLQDVGGDINVEPVDFVAADGGVSRGLLYRADGTFPSVGVHLMHPRTNQELNYNILPLVRAGYAVLGRAGRWVNNDIATVHEKLLLDVAAGVDLLRSRGCEQVILLGNSGGGSLAALFQSQARADSGSRFACTAAHDPVDRSGIGSSAADGVVLIGGHLGEGASLLKWIDPSVTDEGDPLAADPELDMYNPQNGFVPLPGQSRYGAGFLRRYRSAQRARVARIDQIARERVGDRREAQAGAAAATGVLRARYERRAADPRHLTIYRTMADPAFVDLSLEPDDRRISSYNNDLRPDLQNYGDGVARFLTSEAWLSTWSGLSSRARTLECLGRITDPLLIVHYAGDVITHIAEAQAMLEASAASDKRLHIVRGADHYGFAVNPDGSGGPRTTEGTDQVVSWMKVRFPLRQRSGRVPSA